MTNSLFLTKRQSSLLFNALEEGYKYFLRSLNQAIANSCNLRLSPTKGADIISAFEVHTHLA
jgi:hypothetical protein